VLDRVLADTRTFLTGSEVSDFLELEAVVGRMKAGNVLLDRGVIPAPEEFGVLRVKLPIVLNVDLTDGDLVLESLSYVESLDVEFRGVILPEAVLLFPELERDKFSFELPESPRFTFTELYGMVLEVDCLWLAKFLLLRVDALCCVGASGLLAIPLLRRKAEAFDALLVGTLRSELSLDCLVREPTDRRELFRDTGREEDSSDPNPLRIDLVMFLNGEEYSESLERDLLLVSDLILELLGDLSSGRTCRTVLTEVPEVSDDLEDLRLPWLLDFGTASFIEFRIDPFILLESVASPPFEVFS